MASVYDILDQVTTALGENTLLAGKTVNNQKELAGQNIALQEAMNPSALAVSAQKTQGDFQAQEAARKVSSELGNDPNDPNSLLSILVQDYRENMIAAREQRASIAEKQQVGIFDDVLQFMVNQVTLPDEINAYNATLGKANVAKEGIATMQSLTTAAAQAQHATAQKLTKDSIKAQAEVDAAVLNQKINTLKLEQLGYDLEGIKISNHNNAQVAQYAMAAHSMQLQDAAALRAAEESKWRKEAKADTEEEMAAYAQKVSIGAKAQGLPELSIGEIKARIKFGSPAEKARLESLYMDGSNIIAQGNVRNAGSLPVGSSPGDAILNASLTGGLKGPEFKGSRDLLEKVAREAYQELEARQGKITKMTPDVRASIVASINDKLYGAADPKTGKRKENTGLLYRMASDVEREGSIMKAPSLDLMANVPSVQNNPLYESVIKPAVAAGVKASDPATLLSLSAEAMKRGNININQMSAGIADFYKSASVQAWTNSGAAKFAIPYYGSYVAKVPSSTAFSSSEYWDFSKPESVRAYYLQLETTRRLENIGVTQ